MIQLTLEQLLEIHAIIFSAKGGSLGIRDLGRLESAIATQSQNIFGDELYVSIFDKSGALIRGIIGDHPFVDGNKRTAILAGLTLLELNKKKFTANLGEIEDYAVLIATELIDVPAISKWLRNHSE